MSDIPTPNYPTGPMAVAQVELLRRTIEATVDALRAERCSELVVNRVTNRLIYGHPDGMYAHTAPDDDRQVSLDFLGLIAHQQPPHTAVEHSEHLARMMATIRFGDEISLAPLHPGTYQ